MPTVYRHYFFTLAGANTKVGRPLFWSAGPLSAAQQTTEMIAEQRTGKNSEPALADYQDGVSAIPLFSIFWPILKIFQREEIIK
jgi:hypothetical protein